MWRMETKTISIIHIAYKVMNESRFLPQAGALFKATATKR
ncbi:Uncharacterized protein ChrSV_2736 [Chromobacterium vaccinii]|nr:Uncharacterized protein ChrSW_2736 [Chromobacterium vaccinii]QND90193.1 Uncharacterized protein ChrSV_2736 [Chromobacterium vaccinii]